MAHHENKDSPIPEVQNVDATIDTKAVERQKLTQNLIDTFRKALEYYSSDCRAKEKVVWWVRWKIDSDVPARGGTLHISRVSSDAFFFDLALYDGARLGQVPGKAQILTPHSAYGIEVGQGIHCSSFHGLSATFSGTYKHATKWVVNGGYLDEIDLNELGRITGPYLKIFLNNFHQIHSKKTDSSTDLTVITVGVKGMYNIMESIVILDNMGTIWCACLDPEAKVVRYFTNAADKSAMKPSAIKDWLSKFSDRLTVENKNEDINDPPSKPKHMDLLTLFSETMNRLKRHKTNHF